MSVLRLGSVGSEGRNGLEMVLPPQRVDRPGQLGQQGVKQHWLQCPSTVYMKCIAVPGIRFS